MLKLSYQDIYRSRLEVKQDAKPAEEVCTYAEHSGIGRRSTCRNVAQASHLVGGGERQNSELQAPSDQATHPHRWAERRVLQPELQSTKPWPMSCRPGSKELGIKRLWRKWSLSSSYAERDISPERHILVPPILLTRSGVPLPLSGNSQLSTEAFGLALYLLAPS